MRNFNLEAVGKLLESIRYLNHPESIATEEQIEFITDMYRNLLYTENMTRHVIDLPIYIQLVLLEALNE